MKAIICNPRGLQKIGRPLDCNVFRNGYCGIFRKELQMDCDAEPVRVIPAAEYDAQQTAIAAAKKALVEIVLWRGCYESIKTDEGIKQFRKDLKQADDALSQLRAVKEAE